MTKRAVLTPALLLLSTALAVPAFAQHRNRGEGNNQPRAESSAPRERAAPRGDAGRPSAPQTYQRAMPRPAPRYDAPRSDSRRYDGRSYDGRGYGSRGYGDRYYGRNYDQRYYGRGYDPRYYGRGYGYGYGPRVYVSPYSYAFRPRLRIGFGIYVGYPFAYPYSYPYYPYSAPAYGYPGPMVVRPGGAYGGISLQISPGDGDVFIDGTFVGRVDEFYDPSHPLTVTAGRHRVEVQSDGYAPLVFDVDVAPGQVIPYQGSLQPY